MDLNVSEGSQIKLTESISVHGYQVISDLRHDTSAIMRMVIGGLQQVPLPIIQRACYETARLASMNPHNDVLRMVSVHYWLLVQFAQGIEDSEIAMEKEESPFDFSDCIGKEDDHE